MLISYLLLPHSFSIYDADNYAPARFLLPARRASLLPAVDSAPGEAGRWKLPEDLSEMQAASTMMQRMQRMYFMYTMYYLLQGAVLVGLMLRLIM